MHDGRQTSRKAGRGCPQPCLHLQRVPDGILDAGRGGAGPYSRKIVARSEGVARLRAGFKSTAHEYRNFWVDWIKEKSLSAAVILVGVPPLSIIRNRWYIKSDGGKARQSSP